MTQFIDGDIEGVVVRRFARYDDDRGWLCELFRKDEVAEAVHPAMCYASSTLPGVMRGPHEHVAQTDWLCFVGPSNFVLVLWDNRPSSPTYHNRMKLIFGEKDPGAVIVPQGVVHAYRNVGNTSGLVINLPNRLYKGEGRGEPVDEIRHEEDSESVFRMDA